ncbi:hypothetical protein [Alienimonas sp. DA493]|uniref:hypothetical protein n=1 Tax=Alienimonas sp. DA493 TaxID=3373605 RepID=UPI0037551F0E
MTTTTDPAGPSADPSLWREAAAAGAFVLAAAIAGGALAGGFTAIAAGSPHGQAAVAEQWEVETSGSRGPLTRYARVANPRTGFALGVWRGVRFGAAAAGLAVLCTAFPGPPQVRLWGALPLIAVVAAGTVVTTAAAAGVGFVLGSTIPRTSFSYVDGAFRQLDRDEAASALFAAAAVGREALFWGGVGWSAFAALWLRTAARRGAD